METSLYVYPKKIPLDAEFFVKPAFKKVLTVAGPLKESHLPYGEIWMRLAGYFAEHEKHMHKTSDMNLFHVGEDLLGEVFGVKTFHRFQLETLVLWQLSPYHPCLEPPQEDKVSYDIREIITMGAFPPAVETRPPPAASQAQDAASTTSSATSSTSTGGGGSDLSDMAMELFTVKPRYRAFLDVNADFPFGKYVFSFMELYKHLADYIVEHSDSFYDKDRPGVLVIEGTPLGNALDMETLTQTESVAALRQQLNPYPPE